MNSNHNLEVIYEILNDIKFNLFCKDDCFNKEEVIVKSLIDELLEENREEDIEEEIDIDIQSELEEDYIDAFDNIVYLDEIGVEEDSELDELTEEIYPGIRKLKRNK